MSHRASITAAVAAAVTAVCAAPAAMAATLPSGFNTVREVSGLTRATKVVWAPDGRRFIVEKDGVLKVAAPGSTSAQTVLDLRADVNHYWDRGLLGLAIDSDFANHPYLYLLYTYDLNKSTTAPGPDTGHPMVAQLRRVTVGANSQLVSQQVILGTYTNGPCPTPSNTLDCIPSEGFSHSIGTVISAPDGTLYVGVGDGADWAVLDPLALRAYDERSMSGKILHVDRNGRGLPGHPFCPAQTNLDLVCAKLHAKGFRNPFRFTQLPSGGLLVADVGWNSYEELDLVTVGGKSYGWPCYEGSIRTPTWKDTTECAEEYKKEGTAAAHVGPIHDYWHDYGLHPSWAAIAGPEYTGNSYPAGFRGSIFWGDHGAGFIRRLTLNGAGQVASMHNFATGWHGVDLTAAPNGDLAWVELGGFQANQAFVERVVYSPGNAKPNAVAAATPTSGATPLTVQFDGSASTDSDGDALAYSWNFGDGSAPGSGAKPSHTYTSPGSYTATLTVSDGRGQSDTDTVQINASNSPPVPVIEAPVAGFKYRNGVSVAVRGSATDADEGTLPASAFEWNVRIVHHDHEHSLANEEGVTHFEFVPTRDHDSDSFYRIRLTVTDARGATRSVEREIHPETVPLHLRSIPSGAPLSYAGTPATAPWDTNAAIGFLGTISAPQTFTSGGVERDFVKWSHGVARIHNFTVPASETTLTATYNAKPTAAATASPTAGAAPLSVSFDASESNDPDNHALSYSWDFGDGTAPSSAMSPAHAYAAAGAYDATLTVTDELGARATDTVRVTVSPPSGSQDDDGGGQPGGGADAGGGAPGVGAPGVGAPGGATGGGGTPGGEIQPAAKDTSGPTLRAWRPRARPRFLAGTVSDPAGVAAVRIAVAVLAGERRCRWVSAGRARVGAARGCSPRRWVTASLSGRRWELPLPTRLAAGRYRAWLLAVDRLGNTTRRTVDGHGQLRFRVTRAAARAMLRQAAASRACGAPLLLAPLGCDGLPG